MDEKPQSSHPETHDQRTWDHGSTAEFLDYYASASLTPETRARFASVRNMILREAGAAMRDRHLEVADIGCGAGAQCQLWAELGHSVHGLDINAPLIELARRRAAETNQNIQFEIGSATALPWPDESMDICLSPELLEHVQDWETCISEFVRILKPGGVLYLSTTNKLCPRQQEFDLPLYSWYPSQLKRHYERLAVTSRPELVNHAIYPAVNWFTYYQLRDRLRTLGLESRDRFDVMDVATKGTIVRMIVRLIRAFPPLRWCAHVATSYAVVVAIKGA